MVRSFNNVIHVYTFIRDTNRVGFEDVTRLVMRQAATFNMIEVVSEIYLCTMINSPF